MDTYIGTATIGTAKAAASKCLKKAKPFKISEDCVMEITDSAVGVKDTYSGEFIMHTILKKGYKWDTFAPEPLPHVSAKQDDTLKLLMELKPPQPVVDWYNETLGGDGPVVNVCNSSDEDSD